MWLIRFSINNPLVTNLLLGIILILGVLSWRAMPQEMFPTVELDAVSIRVEFEGASPEEVKSSARWSYPSRNSSTACPRSTS